MASTTEELTGQSDQLVSALSFFNTGDEGRKSSARAGKPQHTVPGKPIHASAHGAAGAKASSHAGINLRLNEKHDDTDAEFERY
jgi:hypothetical protein